MAMNSKKRKFLATSLTATMVAAAVAPAAGFAAEAEKPFPDVELGTPYTDPIMKLKEAGVIEGNPDGTFGIRQKLTRAQAALMFTNIRDLDTKVEAAPFADVKQGVWYSDAINAAHAAGVINGNPDGTFNPNGNLTRAEFAVMVVNAYGLDIKTDVELPFTDVKEDAWYTKYIKTLYANDLIAGKNATIFAPGENVDRGDFARLLADTDVQYGHKLKEEAVAPEVVSVSAINAKTLKVEFNQAVDPEKATIAVKKGTVTANVAKKEFSEDNKSVTLELSSKLTEGEYTVTVSGLTEDALTATYKAENEKVADINFLSDKAIINTAGTDVVVAYEILNQYGEDITRTTSVNAVSSLGTVTVNATKSELTIPYNTATNKVGDKFSLSLVNVESGVSETGTITISDASQVTDVEIKSLYHETDKVLDADEANISDYKLIVEVKDQYGKKLDAAKANTDLLVRVSDTTVVDVDSYSSATNTATFKDLKIDGKDVVVLELAAPANGLKAGKSTVNVISKYSGKTSAYEVTVNEGVKTNGITLSQPDLVVAGETVSIPFEATDMYGNALTKANVLNSGIKFTVSGTGSYAGTNGADALSFDVDKNGKTVLNLTVPANAQGNATITALTDNQKFASLTVNVKKAATPVAITGIDKDVYTNVLEGENLTFKVEDLVAEDQYGRQMSGTKLKTYLAASDTTTAGDLVIDVEDANTAGGAIDTLSATRIGASTVDSFTVKGANRGTEGLKFALVEYVDGTNDKVVAGSEFEKSIRVVKQSDIVSYDMDDVPVMYDEAGAGNTEDAAYSHEVEVFGLLSNGTKVFIPQQDAGSNDLYQVTTNNTSLDYSSDKLNVNAAATYEPNKTETTAKATVTINATGDRIVKDVVISKVAPKVEKVVYDVKANPTKISETADGFLVVESAGSIDTAADHFGLLKITDQYGAVATITGATGIITFKDATTTSVPGTVTFSNLDKGSSAAIADNGTFKAAFSGLAAGDTYTSTINLPNGKSTVANVIVK